MRKIKAGSTNPNSSVRAAAYPVRTFRGMEPARVRRRSPRETPARPWMSSSFRFLEVIGSLILTRVHLPGMSLRTPFQTHSRRMEQEERPSIWRDENLPENYTGITKDKTGQALTSLSCLTLYISPAKRNIAPHLLWCDISKLMQ